MINIFNYYFQKYPLIFDYFNFLRDLLLMLQLFLVLFLILKTKNKYLLFNYFLSIIIAFLITQFLKNYFLKLRPLSYVSPFKSFDSFPSQHVTLSFISSLFLIFQNLRYGILSLVLTSLIAIFSWLSLRHWIIDIFGGFIIGFLIFISFKNFYSLLTGFISKILKRKIK